MVLAADGLPSRIRRSSAPGVFHYRGKGAPQWPDPTQAATFPHVTQDRDGYRVTTEPH